MLGNKIPLNPNHSNFFHLVFNLWEEVGWTGELIRLEKMDRLDLQSNFRPGISRKAAVPVNKPGHIWDEDGEFILGLLDLPPAFIDHAILLDQLWCLREEGSLLWRFSFFFGGHF